MIGHGLIFQSVFLAGTYNDTIIIWQKKINITDFHQSLHTLKVDSTSKGNWYGIEIEQSKRNEMTRDRLEWSV